MRVDAHRDQDAGVGRTYLALYEGELVGYVTLLADAIALSRKGRNIKGEELPYPSAPALKIGRLAADLRTKGQGVGRDLLQFTLDYALNVVAPSVGCRFQTLDSLPDRVGFYEKHGFLRNTKVAANFKKVQGEQARNVSMRFDIRGQLAP